MKLRRTRYSCEVCGAHMKPGPGFRKETAPGAAAQCMAALALMLGIAIFLAVLLYGRQHDLGPGVGVIAGILTYVVINEIAARLPRVRRLRCAACGQKHEIAAR